MIDAFAYPLLSAVEPPPTKVYLGVIGVILEKLRVSTDRRGRKENVALKSAIQLKYHKKE